jgi:hypothetical protein
MADPTGYFPDGHGGKMIPSYNTATPGVGGAIGDAIKALARALAPKSITQRGAQLQQQEQQATGQAPPQQLGNQF